MYIFFLSLLACFDWGIMKKIAPHRLAHRNYGEQVWTVAEEKEIPYAYLMALIVLECSGELPCGNRTEPHVYDRLKKVQQGTKSSYQHVKKKHLKKLSDEGLKNLATSWGPFQLMGYQAIELNSTVSDIRSTELGVELGARWIKKNYGNDLKAGRFKDAFHKHNTGQPYPADGKPKTHDPEYVNRGLHYMEIFSTEEYRY
ncbi:MAG: hypothetical protein CMK59_13865 [Proteobacteria bacterium]|nr:hypothetical protein [Pseudomonadota bacterium]